MYVCNIILYIYYYGIHIIWNWSIPENRKGVQVLIHKWWHAKTTRTGGLLSPISFEALGTVYAADGNQAEAESSFHQACSPHTWSWQLTFSIRLNLRIACILLPCRPWGFSRRTATRTLALSVISMPCCRAWRLLDGSDLPTTNSVHSASKCCNVGSLRWTKDDKGTMIVEVIIGARDHWRDWVKCFLVEGCCCLIGRAAGNANSSRLELKSESWHVKSCRSQSMHLGMVINDDSRHGKTSPSIGRKKRRCTNIHIIDGYWWLISLSLMILMVDIWHPHHWWLMHQRTLKCIRCWVSFPSLSTWWWDGRPQDFMSNLACRLPCRFLWPQKGEGPSPSKTP